MTAHDEIRRLITGWQHDIEVATERVRLATELLEALDDEPDTTTTSPTSTVKPKSARVACPDCGEHFFAQGLPVHRARRHPSSAAKPVELRSVPFDADAARERAAAAI